MEYVCVWMDFDSISVISCSLEVNFHKTEVVTEFQFGGGIMGPPGPPGVCSCNLTTFLNSLSLQDAIPGPPGLPGIDGKAGPPGTSVSQHAEVYISCYTHIQLSQNNITTCYFAVIECVFHPVFVALCVEQW